MAVMALGLVSCNPEPDESNQFNSVKQTLGMAIDERENLSSFNYILQRSGMDRVLDAYEQVTCFAPTNEAIQWYIDSLYTDEMSVDGNNKLLHNGMTSNSLEGLTDSLCNDIALYHIVGSPISMVELQGTKTTMLKMPISVGNEDNSGLVQINGKALIYDSDKTIGEIETSNGYLYVLDNVIPKNSMRMGDRMARLKDYSIFAKALELTGLADSVSKTYKTDETGQNIQYTITDYYDNMANNAECYWPKECQLGYTIFAETDEVFKSKGINSIEDLIAKCNEWYGNADSWYDYPREKGITISKENDYTNRFNTLNMFVAYHILFAKMASDQLVYERRSGGATPPAGLLWNYCNGGEPYDYYETMLPHTLMKIWNPSNKLGKRLFINRAIENNTLTDEVGTMGSESMHRILRPGVEIVREDVMALNGYIHPIKDILLYDADVPQKVLNERLRFDSSEFLPELINNGFRYMSVNEVSAMNGGGHGVRIAFPLNFFDNVVCFSEQTVLRYNVKGWYRAYQTDAFQGWGNYDLAIKLPPVPTGQYELRLFYSPMAHAGMMQFYLGTSSNPQSMTALGIPLDARIDKEDPLIGWVDFTQEDDRGIATDAAMRNRGYMRGPYSFFGGTGVTSGNSEATNCRGDGVATLRLLLGTDTYRQSDDHWFRIKSVIDDKDLKWQLDFVELVPKASIVDNTQYLEDWY